MTKYHVNPKTGATGLCSAKKKCWYGGESGLENHYTTLNDAEAAGQKILVEKYGDNFKGLSKTTKSAKVQSANDTLRNLKDNGARVRKITDVGSHDFGKGIDTTVSNIDVLDTPMNHKDLLNQIRSGKAPMFKQNKHT